MSLKTKSFQLYEQQCIYYSMAFPVVKSRVLTSCCFGFLLFCNATGLSFLFKKLECCQSPNLSLCKKANNHISQKCSVLFASKNS